MNVPSVVSGGSGRADTSAQTWHSSLSRTRWEHSSLFLFTFLLDSLFWEVDPWFSSLLVPHRLLPDTSLIEKNQNSMCAYFWDQLSRLWPLTGIINCDRSTKIRFRWDKWLNFLIFMQIMTIFLYFKSLFPEWPHNKYNFAGIITFANVEKICEIPKVSTSNSVSPSENAWRV